MWARLGRSYQTFAIVLLNCFLLFIAANLIALPFVDLGFNPYDPKSHRDQWLDRHGIETMRRVYPGLGDKQIKDLLLQAGRFGQVFEPYIHTKSEPMVLEHTAFHPAGFRMVGREQGPWPMSPDAFNVFVFGGSTVVGSGVRDDHAIPAVLQQMLRERFGDKAINVYNFATAGHYSTQERIYFEQLILRGHVPHAVVFVDGLNDFFYWHDEPAHTSMMRSAYAYMATRADYRSLLTAIKAVVIRLPLTQLAQRYYHYARTGQMPKASLISTAHAADNPYAERTRIDAVIERYFRFKQMAAAVAESFGIVPVFVWQPVPLYRYDGKLRLFPVIDDHLIHEHGYPVMAQRAAGRDMGKDFIWCADAFERAARPLYLDAVHYTIEGNEMVASCIVEAIVGRGLFDKKLTRHGEGFSSRALTAPAK